MHSPSWQKTAAAYAVHAFTASGSVVALFAMLAAASANWAAMFGWLGVALVIDGVDGPLARWADTKANAGRYSGDIMDWVIDFVTYVFIPAYALATGPLLDGAAGWVAAAVVMLSGTFYFADTTQKTSTNHFKGFPAVWNLLLLYLFLWNGPAWFNLSIIAAMAVLTFAPIDFVHPTRVKRWRGANLAVAALALGLSVWAVAAALNPPSFVVVALTLCAAYAWGIGLLETYSSRFRKAE